MNRTLPESEGHPPRFLLFCQHTAATTVRSGVQRVVVELARELVQQTDVDFVKWDEIDGQLRFMDRRDLRHLLGGDTVPNPRCHSAATRFGDLIDGDTAPWLLYPEIPSHLADGNEKFSRIVSQCREYGVRVAAIFYDLIPVREAAYAAGRSSHQKYMAELARCDLIIPISRFAGEDLLAYYEHDAGLAGVELEHVRTRVHPVSLGEMRRGEPWASRTPTASAAAENPIRLVMVGTVEPRKQQTRLLRVLNDGRSRFPVLQNVRVDVYGSLHPDSADALWAEVKRNSHMRFHHYAPESVIEAAYANASFTAFPSLNEGYGLPIVESLRRGVPCLTADFGAMAEVADGGGCLTVDVRDDAAIVDGLVRLAGDAGLRRRLRDEIDQRPRRSWVNYASDILSIVGRASATHAEDCRQFRAQVESWLVRSTGSAEVFLGGRAWQCRWLGQEGGTGVPSRSTGLILGLPAATEARTLSREHIETIADADLLILDDTAQQAGLVDAANRLDLGVPLPDAVLAAGADAAAMADRALELARQRSHALDAALVESTYQTACRQAPIAEGQIAELAIVISTYNRGPFVEMNVEWLLRQIDKESLPVECVVVDNTSTDDTATRLARFAGHPRFKYECNSANTGMLGNLRVCSTKLIARYAWVTGDDDFIAPGAIARTLAIIRAQPGLPLILHNFGVYHRERITTDDHPEMFFAELQPLASNASPSGLYPVNAIAAEHDNLFTAIYPIVFRSDLLAACFNYPFDGIPFGDLVECVPTTKFILETLPFATATWVQEIGIVGNSHNSWSGHRPRWHLLLMPEVMRLARRAGVDPQRLWAWSRVHEALFKEAVDIAVARNLAAHLTAPEDFETASYFFRKSVAVPPKLRLGLKSDRWIDSVEDSLRPGP
jgi:glycosyltransferase involved in cell wall biosynthesis